MKKYVRTGTSDQKGKRHGNGSGPLNAKASTAADNAKCEADLQAVPSGDETQVISCPVCKETLNSEFLEDDEDWVWKSAIKKRVCFIYMFLCANFDGEINIYFMLSVLPRLLH